MPKSARSCLKRPVAGGRRRGGPLLVVRRRPICEVKRCLAGALRNCRSHRPACVRAWVGTFRH
eukprot:9493260-Alexandrium_andersonii.AAC.1